MEKINGMFLDEFLKFKHNRPANLVEEDPIEIKLAETRKELKAYGTQIEIHELINRKVMKLRCNLFYGPEKQDLFYENKELDFNYE